MPAGLGRKEERHSAVLGSQTFTCRHDAPLTIMDPYDAPLTIMDRYDAATMHTPS
jgi:hypothetical protein